MARNLCRKGGRSTRYPFESGIKVIFFRLLKELFSFFFCRPLVNYLNMAKCLFVLLQVTAYVNCSVVLAQFVDCKHIEKQGNHCGFISLVLKVMSALGIRHKDAHSKKLGRNEFGQFCNTPLYTHNTENTCELNESLTI